MADVTHRACGVILLAAGQGKRMRSALPKVLHEVGGKPLLFHVLNQIREVNREASIAIVVGHGRDSVEAFIRREPTFSDMNIHFIHQAEQKGTGHAALCAMNSEWGKNRLQEKASILVLPGDLPLVPSSLIEQMLVPLKTTEGMRLLTCELVDPTGYGRVIRKGMGPVLKIVEERDALPKEKLIREVATSIYFFQAAILSVALKSLSNDNAQGEYYLTDVVAEIAKSSKKVSVLLWTSPDDLRGVNDLWELAQAGQMMNERLLRMWALRGVRVMDPQSTRVDVTVQLGEGVTLHPGAILMGTTRIGAGSIVGARAVLKDMEIEDHVYIKTGTVAESSKIGSQAQVGPYAHLRPESCVRSRAKIGNFVELKKAEVGEGSSVAHLSYVGDATIGKNVNIGCGFVTCNFDGRVVNGERKHHTIIEDDVFLGSDCQVVAPIRIGKGAYVASGSTVTEDVPPGDLAIARSRQVNKSGYAQKMRQPK